MANASPVKAPPGTPQSESKTPVAAGGHMAATDHLKRGSLKQRVVNASAWVISGLLAAQVLKFGSNLVLVRMLVPEQFGLMLMVNVVLQGVTMFSDVGLRVSVVRHADGDQERFVNTAWTIQVMRGFMLWIAVLAAAWPVSVIYEEPQLLAIIPVIGLNTVLLGFASTAAFTLTRHVRFGRQVRVQLTGQVLGVILMVIWAWLWPSVWALVAGSMFQIVFQCAASYWLIPGYRNRFAWDWEAAREIFSFGKWIFISTGLQFFILQGDKAVMGKLLTTADAGVFAIAAVTCESLLQILRRLSTEVLLPVYSRLSESGDREHFRAKTLQLRSVLLAMMLPPLWILAIFAQPIIDFFFPPTYAGAGQMLQILAIGSVGTVISLTADRVTTARGDSYRAMVVQIVRAALLVIGMTAGGYLGGTMGVLMGVAASRIVDYPVVVWSIRRYDAWLPALDLAAFALSGAVIGLGITFLG